MRLDELEPGLVESRSAMISLNWREHMHVRIGSCYKHGDSMSDGRRLFDSINT